MKQRCFNRIIALGLILAIVLSNVQNYSVKAESIEDSNYVVTDESNFVSETISKELLYEKEFLYSSIYSCV